MEDLNRTKKDQPPQARDNSPEDFLWTSSALLDFLGLQSTGPDLKCGVCCPLQSHEPVPFYIYTHPIGSVSGEPQLTQYSSKQPKHRPNEK